MYTQFQAHSRKRMASERRCTGNLLHLACQQTPGRDPSGAIERYEHLHSFGNIYASTLVAESSGCLILQFGCMQLGSLVTRCLLRQLASHRHLKRVTPPFWHAVAISEVQEQHQKSSRRSAVRSLECQTFKFQPKLLVSVNCRPSWELADAPVPADKPEHVRLDESVQFVTTMHSPARMHPLPSRSSVLAAASSTTQC